MVLADCHTTTTSTAPATVVVAASAESAKPSAGTAHTARATSSNPSLAAQATAAQPAPEASCTPLGAPCAAAIAATAIAAAAIAAVAIAAAAIVTAAAAAPKPYRLVHRLHSHGPNGFARARRGEERPVRGRASFERPIVCVWHCGHGRWATVASHCLHALATYAHP